MTEFWRKQQVPTVTTGGTGAGWLNTFSCNCIGPRNGGPRCPCAMRNVIERDGRWIVPEQDLGPVRRPHAIDQPVVSANVWPAGCPKERACSRHGDCMYGCKAHAARPTVELRREIDAATAHAHRNPTPTNPNRSEER